MHELQTKIAELMKTKQRIIIIGIGENRMGDDGFGPYMIYRLISRIKKEIGLKYDTQMNTFHTPTGKQVKLMNAGITIESRIQEILHFNPDFMLLIDAIETSQFDQERIFLVSEYQFVPILPISSHSLPVQLVLRIIREKIALPEVYLLGIKPRSLEIPDRFVQFEPEIISLDDFDENPDLPFFQFNLSHGVLSNAHYLEEKMVKILLTL